MITEHEQLKNEERELRKTVRKLSMLQKFPNGRVYHGRGRVDPFDDAAALERITVWAKSREFNV